VLPAQPASLSWDETSFVFVSFKLLPGRLGWLPICLQVLFIVNNACTGEMDHLPEVAFYMVGSIEEVVKKAERLAEERR